MNSAIHFRKILNFAVKLTISGNTDQVTTNKIFLLDATTRLFICKQKSQLFGAALFYVRALFGVFVVTWHHVSFQCWILRANMRTYFL